MSEIERLTDNAVIDEANYRSALDTIERLTAALVEIRDYPEGEDGRLDSMEAIAREALQEVINE